MRPLPLLALIALTACGGPFYAEVDEPEVCKTLAGHQVPGVPDAGTQTVELPLSYDFRKAVDRQATDGEVELTRLVLTARSGVSDLGFIDSAELSVVPGAPAADVPLVEYQRSGAVGAELDMPGNGTDLLPYARKGPVPLALKLTGVLPSVDWSLDLKACLHIRARR